MRNILRLIGFFVIVKIITSFKCPENDIKGCKCTNVFNESIQFTCIDPSNDIKSNNKQYFEIFFDSLIIKIKCIESSDLANFQYDFKFLKNGNEEYSILTIDNCKINQNTDISKIEELFDNTVLVNYHLNNITQINDILKENSMVKLNALYALEITNNINLEVLPENEFFIHVPFLYNLTITGNSIKSIKRNAFNPLNLLTRLNLSENNIRDIEPGTFDILTSLVQLDLSKNELETLHDNIFQNLKQLRRLYLQQNKFTTLSE